MSIGGLFEREQDRLIFGTLIEPYLAHPYIPGLPCFLRKEFFQGREKELNQSTTASYLQVRRRAAQLLKVLEGK